MDAQLIYQNKDVYFSYINEKWKEYPDNKQYLVSCMGRIRSKEQKVKHNYGGIAIKKERILTQTDNEKGYLSVGLTFDGKTKTTRVSRMVAITWVSNPENKPQVNHKNGIKHDNRKENLEWATSGENVMHAWNTGLAKKRESYIELQKRTNQILQYVCHDIEVQTPKGRGRVVIDSTNIRIRYESGAIENLIKSIRFWGNDFKLVLISLSRLTKEIEHKGEKFVPIVKIADTYIVPRKHILNGIFAESKYGRLWYEIGSNRFLEEEGHFDTICPMHIFEMYQKLFELHIDVFNLIPEGLAIAKPIST